MESLSKLRYNLGIVGNLWIDSGYSEKDRRFRKYTKRDNKRLQSTQKQALRTAMGKREKNTTTETLVNKDNKMSVYQEITYQIAINAKKIMETKKLESIYRQIVREKMSESRKENYVRKKTKTAIAEENFVCHAINLLNTRATRLLAEEKRARFKKK